MFAHVGGQDHADQGVAELPPSGQFQQQQRHPTPLQSQQGTKGAGPGEKIPLHPPTTPRRVTKVDEYSQVRWQGFQKVVLFLRQHLEGNSAVVILQDGYIIVHEGLFSRSVDQEIVVEPRVVHIMDTRRNDGCKQINVLKLAVKPALMQEKEEGLRHIGCMDCVCTQTDRDHTASTWN